jgi:hypothetical protein
MDPKLMEQFSREELVAMGEEVETPTPGPETQETEEVTETEPKTPEQKTEPEVKETETETKEESEPEPEEGKPVPYERFSKIYGRAKQTEREKAELTEKLDLFKRNPEEYFEKYPDEKPADYKSAKETPTEPAPTKVLTFREMLGARVNDPNMPQFHGKSLAELMGEGPEGIAVAQDLYAEYVQSVHGKVQAAKAKEEETLKQLREEDNAFMNTRATSLFGKPLSEATPEQRKQVEKEVSDTIAWMKKNGRMAYKLADAYKVMKFDDLLKEASAKGASALVDHAKKGTVRSVGAGLSAATADPYAAFLAMSESDLEAKFRDMPDAKFEKFLKDATPAFRQKFSALPYPD